MPRRGLARRDDAVAGVVAGIIMLGALVAFMAYFAAVWVPTYVGNKESTHAVDVRTAMEGYADSVEDRIARDVVGRSLSRSVPLGVSGIPVLGKGASAGDLNVETGPTLTATLNGAPLALATGSGAVSLSTHTTQYPNQTYRYTLGALEIVQSEGAFVDLRSLLNVQRGGAGHLNATLQVVDITGGTQAAAGNGQASMGATVNAIENATEAAGDLRITISGLKETGGAWRVAIDRTFHADLLLGETLADCSVSTKNYCFTSATNDATHVDVTIRDLAAGWSVTRGSVAAEVRA